MASNHKHLTRRYQTDASGDTQTNAKVNSHKRFIRSIDIVNQNNIGPFQILAIQSIKIQLLQIALCKISYNDPHKRQNNMFHEQS